MAGCISDGDMPGSTAGMIAGNTDGASAGSMAGRINGISDGSVSTDGSEVGNGTG